MIFEKLIQEYAIILLIFVAFIWGVTNPFIRKGSVGLERIKAQSIYKQHIEELLFLITNLKYMGPYITSQLGSVLYFQLLQNINVSLAVPISSSLTFIVTAITGQIMQEEKLHKCAYFGMVLVLLGIIISCWDVLN